MICAYLWAHLRLTMSQLAVMAGAFLPRLACIVLFLSLHFTSVCAYEAIDIEDSPVCQLTSVPFWFMHLVPIFSSMTSSLPAWSTMMWMSTFQFTTASALSISWLEGVWWTFFCWITRIHVPVYLLTLLFPWPTSVRHPIRSYGLHNSMKRKRNTS